jgi:hypothetical protein
MLSFIEFTPIQSFQFAVTTPIQGPVNGIHARNGYPTSALAVEDGEKRHQIQQDPHRLLHSCPRPPCETDIGHVTRFPPFSFTSSYCSSVRCLIILGFVFPLVKQFCRLPNKQFHGTATENNTITNRDSFSENWPVYLDDRIFDINQTFRSLWYPETIRSC